MEPEPEATIRLDQFLKLVGAVGTGGEAKVLIQAGEIQVNDQVETRRRRKLTPGDVVQIEDDSFTVELDEEKSGDSE